MPNNSDTGKLVEKKLVFVYHADSGLFNTVADIAHKIFSPKTYECHLCALTHSYFSVRDKWSEFISKLPIQCEFLHRDEFLKIHNKHDYALPAVFLHDAGDLQLFIASDDINTCESLEQLQALIQRRIDDMGVGTV